MPGVGPLESGPGHPALTAYGIQRAGLYSQHEVLLSQAPFPGPCQAHPRQPGPPSDKRGPSSASFHSCLPQGHGQGQRGEGAPAGQVGEGIALLALQQPLPRLGTSLKRRIQVGPGATGITRVLSLCCRKVITFKIKSPKIGSRAPTKLSNQVSLNFVLLLLRDGALILGSMADSVGITEPYQVTADPQKLV